MKTHIKVIGKEQCPKCASIGNDRSKDNLVKYSDGGMHCFACSYHVYPNGREKLIRSPTIDERTITYTLPSDLTNHLTVEAIEWLQRYHLTLNDIVRNRIMWSDSLKWLVFPIFIDNQMIGFQARNFNKDKPYKWITKFPKNDYVKTYGNSNNNTIILVEDIISSIRLSKFCQVINLFGSSVSNTVWNFLRERRSKPIFWLDRDKAKDAILFAGKARSYGLQSSVIITDLDPKEYNDKEIICLVQN